MMLTPRSVVCYAGLRLYLTQPTQLILIWNAQPTHVALVIKRGVAVQLVHYPQDATLAVELEEEASLLEYLHIESTMGSLCTAQIPLKYRHTVKQHSKSRFTLQLRETGSSCQLSSEVSLIGEGAACNYSILANLSPTQRANFQIVQQLQAENTEATIHARLAVHGPAQAKLAVRSCCYQSREVRVTQDLGGLHLTPAGEITFLPEIYAQHCIPEVLNHQVKIKDLDGRVLEYLQTRGLPPTVAMQCCVSAFLAPTT